MENIKALIGADNKTLKTSKEGVRLLYVAPFVNSNGYYRMILPYLELNKFGFQTRVTSIKKWDFNKTYTIGEETLSEDQIRWADYIIFSTLLMDYSYLLSAIKVLNPKVKLVMDIEDYILSNPKFTAHKSTLRQNLNQIDIITTPHLEQRDVLLNLAGSNDSRLKPIRCYWLPTLISKIGYKALQPVRPSQDDKIRIGIIGSGLHVQDYIASLPLFQNIKAMYCEKVEWLLFGWNGKTKDGYKPLSSAEITFVKPVSFLDYFQKLQQLKIDILYVPFKNTSKYKHYNTIKSKEAAVFGIPTVAPVNSNYEYDIIHGENGVLTLSLKDSEVELKALIDTPKYLKQLKNNVKERVWYSDGYTKENLHFYKKVFR